MRELPNGFYRSLIGTVDLVLTFLGKSDMFGEPLVLHAEPPQVSPKPFEVGFDAADFPIMAVHGAAELTQQLFGGHPNLDAGAAFGAEPAKNAAACGFVEVLQPSAHPPLRFLGKPGGVGYRYPPIELSFGCGDLHPGPPLPGSACIPGGVSELDGLECPTVEVAERLGFRLLDHPDQRPPVAG